MKITRLICSVGLIAAFLTGQAFAAGDSGFVQARADAGINLVAQVVSSKARQGERLNAVHALGSHLSPEAVTALCQFVAARPGQDEYNLPGLRYIKNEVFTALRDQETPPASLSRTVIEIYRDRGQDAVTRDYAIQHLVLWYEQGAGGRMKDKENIRAVLIEAAQDKTSMAGTALLGLHRLFKADSSSQSKTINGYALRMATSSDTDLNARITAVQVCSERKITEALPIIEALALRPEPTALRISAIGALGRLGGAEQAALLRQLQSRSERVMRPAIAAALKQLQPTVASRGPF